MSAPQGLRGPDILNIPSKLLPIIEKFNDYKYFVIEGGRGSGKSQTIARILTCVAEQNKVRIVCGREIQDTIEESVYTLLRDLIVQNSLAFRIRKNGITHLVTGSTFNFKGFREQGSVNIKGFEGADVLWVDEAQTVTKQTLDVIIPTLRKDNVKIIFTLNRYMRDDAVMDLVGRPDCLHIQINYFENPFCPVTLLDEAERMKISSPRDYKHIYLGQPLATADDYLFDFDKLHASFDTTVFGEMMTRQRILSIDFAAQGNDACVATVLDRSSNQHWTLTERIRWEEPDTTVSIGKIVNLLGQYKPDVSILDVGGMGHVVWGRINEVLGKTANPVQRFDGAGVDTMGVDKVHYANARAEGFYLLKDWFEHGFLKLNREDAEVIRQLEKIKMKYRSDGRRILESKIDMKKELGYSPDDADSLMMAVYAAVKFLGRSANSTAASNLIIRKAGSKRKR